MTTDEHIKLTATGDKFWLAFSNLVHKHVKMMPDHLEDLTLTYLQDKCSVYGIAPEEYLKPQPSNNTGNDK